MKHIISIAIMTLTKLKQKITYLFLLIVLTATYSIAQSKSGIQFGTYNFGLDHMNPTEQVDFLEDLGYKSFFFRVKTPKDLEQLKGYNSAVSESDGDFKIESVYYPYRVTDSLANAGYWKKVINELSGKSIRFSLIMWDLDEPSLEKKLIEIVDYAKQANVEIVLYPHYGSSVEDAEDALALIEKLGRPKHLKLSFHLCHEARAGNAYRLNDVASKVKDYMVLTTISGAKKVFFTSGLDWSDAIRPLNDSEYDLTLFMDALNSIEYSGPVILHTFGIKDPAPEVHLKESMTVWKTLIKK